MTLDDSPCTPRARRMMLLRPSRPGLVAGALLVAASLTLIGCGDDAFAPNWVSVPDTVRLYSLDRLDSNLPSGFSFNRRQLIRIETPNATGQWDLGLDTRGGELVFVTPGALNISSQARLQLLSAMELDEVRSAPADSSEYLPPDEPVPVSLGAVYVVRTDQSTGSFGRRCVYHAKFQPLEVDVGSQSVEFVYDTNPVCNDRDLVPPNRN